jgi:hypothetical protein
MRNWKAKAIEDINELLEAGRPADEAVHQVISNFSGVIIAAAEADVSNALHCKQKKAWAEPNDMHQLRFEFDGYEFSTSDAPVRYIDADGQERFKPARFSTGSERVDSFAAGVQHHLSKARYFEGAYSRESQQNAKMIAVGLDPEKIWDENRHQHTKCWRCGLGWRAGDPFERGHSDRPESQGGTQVEWEHRSCNRSAQDNPVARPEDDMPEDDMPEDDAA